MRSGAGLWLNLVWKTQMMADRILFNSLKGLQASQISVNSKAFSGSVLSGFTVGIDIVLLIFLDSPNIKVMIASLFEFVTVSLSLLNQDTLSVRSARDSISAEQLVVRPCLTHVAVAISQNAFVVLETSSLRSAGVLTLIRVKVVAFGEIGVLVSVAVRINCLLLGQL